MGRLNLSNLQKDERILAKVLLKNDIVGEASLQQYMDFNKIHDEVGKEFLGKILIRLGYITEADLDRYILEKEKPYLEFCELLVKDGFIKPEQFQEVKRRHESEGQDVLTAVSDMNIMTRDTFVRSFNNKMFGLRLGEWLKLSQKVTDEQIEKARDAQKVYTLSAYLIHKGLCSKAVIEQVEEKIALAT